MQSRLAAALKISQQLRKTRLHAAVLGAQRCIKRRVGNQYAVLGGISDIWAFAHGVLGIQVGGFGKRTAQAQRHQRQRA